MSAGLPAAALGGALYLLLIVWMVLRELTRPAIVNPSASRWPFIRKMAFVSLAMVAVVLGERWLISFVLEWATLYIPGLAKFVIVPSGSFVLLMVSMPFVILLLIVAFLHGLRFSLGLTKTKPQRLGLSRREYETGFPSERSLERLVIEAD
jgi:hypothetical protein